MKKHALLGVAILSLTIFTQATAESRHRLQATDFDLAITGVTAANGGPSVGAELFPEVSYQNNGPGTVPEDLEVYIQLNITILGTESEQNLGEPCIAKLSEVAGLNSDASQTQGFTTCGYTPFAEGNHNLQAKFVSAAAEGTFVDFQDAQNENNLNEMTLIVTPFESSLPDSLGKLLAGLGVFVAIMAVVAAGTEVVVDTFKVFLGMKSKVDSLEALERMANYLPGDLAALGVEKARIQDISELASQMQNYLNGKLSGIKGLNDFKNNLQDRGLVALLDELDEGRLQDVENLKTSLKTYLTRGIEQAEKQLQLDQNYVAAMRSKLVDPVNKLTAESAADKITEIFKSFREEVLGSEIIGPWMQAQRELISNTGQEGLKTAKDSIEKNASSVLSMFGFDVEDIEKVQERVKLELDEFYATAVQSIDQYIDSATNILDAVEIRRYNTQSIARKIWRKLRQSPWGVLVLPLLLAVVSRVVAWLTGRTLSIPALHFDIPGLLPIADLILSETAQYLSAIFLFSLIGWIMWERRVRENKDTGNTNFVSHILYFAEYFFNAFRGRANQDIASVDKPPSVVERLEEDGLLLGLNEINAENLGQVILARADQQRDENITRLRWARVVSVIVGAWLAYHLNIDGIGLLGQAFPEALKVNDLNIAFLDNIFSTTDRPITPGILLTGFAASLGSAFWYELLKRLRVARETSENAVRIINTLRPEEGTESKG